MTETRRTLDLLGCAKLDCGHDHTVIVFHARCHPGKLTDLFWDESSRVLTLRCVGCSQFVTSVALADAYPQRCHPHAPVRACYDKATGVVTVSCGRCRTESTVAVDW